MNRMLSRAVLSPIALALLATSLGAHAAEPAKLALSLGDTPLIPRAALFGNPAKASAQLSPDGRWLSWRAPVEGVLNLWVAPAGRPQEGRPVTRSKAEPIIDYFWSTDSAQLLYVADQQGDENSHLHGVDVQSGQARDYTPFGPVSARVIALSRRQPGQLLLGLNRQDPRWHDAYRLNLQTGELSLVMKGEGYAGFVADDSLQIRRAMRPNAAGGQDFHKVTDGQVEPQPFLSTTLEDKATQMLDFSADGRTLYWLDSRQGDTTALVAEDTVSGQRTVLGQDARADVGETLVDPVTGAVQAYAIDYLRPEWRFTDPRVKADFQWLTQQLGQGDLYIASRTQADDRWIVGFNPVDQGPRTYVYERKARTLTPLYAQRPDLKGAPLVDMQGVEIRARDGLVLPSYLSLPRSAQPDVQGRPKAPVPMVLLVHGGPNARDTHGYSSEHQWLANRGYAVLSVNFRGSSGFGKRFLHAGNQQWGRAMQDDLHDAVDWAVRQGVTTPGQVAIMGGSYGGYAALAGITFTPTRFACAVDLFGPSNLETLLAALPPRWEAKRKQFHLRVGDPTTEQGRALLRAASPLHQASQVVRPLLIGQGANDPRVKQAESDQFVQALQDRKIPVTYLLYPDEGHGFGRPANRIGFYAVTEAFLGQCLGGRVEPLGDALQRSSGRVVTGAEWVKGLGE